MQFPTVEFVLSHLARSVVLKLGLVGRQNQSQQSQLLQTRQQEKFQVLVFYLLEVDRLEGILATQRTWW